MYSTNEWSKLKKVIVGVADYARVPYVDKSVHTVNYADCENTSHIKEGQYPSRVIEEANEDLENFANFLKSENVEVLRPTRTPTNYYNYCPRDSIFLHGNLALATPMPMRCRSDEYYSMFHHFKHNLKIAPRTYDSELYNYKCIENPDVLALTELAPSFDAANILRANEDVLYLVSNSGNFAGSSYLQECLGDSAKVRTLSGVYSYMHIDSTIALLREGLMLINPSRIKDVRVLPEPFCKWNYIVCPEPKDIGYYSNYCNASKWINMNLFSVDENLVVLEENQHSLRKLLEAHKIDCAMLPMRHQRTLGGGFHCVTLDMERE